MAFDETAPVLAYAFKTEQRFHRQPQQSTISRSTYPPAEIDHRCLPSLQTLYLTSNQTRTL
ncbi:hypothetical protein LguiA_017337 [Lonicera macranthoides]